jgi:putative transposase
MSLRRPRRFAGFSYRGRYRYLLTFCTANRTPVFANAEFVRTARARIEQTAIAEGFAILAHCFMPDHIHLVMEGRTPEADLRRFAKIAKQRVFYSLREKHGLRGIWQEGYHDWILRPEQPIEEAIRYVLENPARASLVDKREDFGHSGADPLGPRYRKPSNPSGRRSRK